MSETTKRLVNRRTWGGVAALAVAAGTLGVAVVVPGQSGGSQKASASPGAGVGVVERGAVKAGEVGVMRYTGGCERLEGEGCRAFTYHPASSGDCYRYAGARWELTPDGRAYFRGTFRSSSGDDAWLMRARLVDDNGSHLGYLRSGNNPGGDLTKFVLGLPDTRKYVHGRNAKFSKHLWRDLDTVSLTKHC